MTEFFTSVAGLVGHISSTPWPHLLAAFQGQTPHGVPYLGYGVSGTVTMDLNLFTLIYSVVHPVY